MATIDFNLREIYGTKGLPKITPSEFMKVVRGEEGIDLDGNEVVQKDAPFNITPAEEKIKRDATTILRALGENHLFVYVSFANSPLLKQILEVFETKSPELFFQPSNPEHYHLTLFIADDVTDQQIEETIADIMYPPEFEVELANLDTFPEAEDNPLIARVTPNEALLDLQARISHAAIKAGIIPSLFSRPPHYIPHITLADELENGMVKKELQGTLSVDKIVFSRKDFATIKGISLRDSPFKLREEDADRYPHYQ